MTIPGIWRLTQWFSCHDNVRGAVEGYLSAFPCVGEDCGVDNATRWIHTTAITLFWEMDPGPGYLFDTENSTYELIPIDELAIAAWKEAVGK